MGVLIDREKCVCCGKCREVCPGNLIRPDAAGRPYVRKPGCCWSCASCIKECPVSAISLVLGPEMDGRGAGLIVSREVRKIRWAVVKNEEELAVFVTNADEANKY